MADPVEDYLRWRQQKFRNLLNSKEGSYEEEADPVEDYLRWRQQKFRNLLNAKALPRAVVSEDEDHRPLFDAALKGDWKTIKKILNEDPAALMAKIMTTKRESFTVLDIAIMATQDQLVEKLVKRFPPEFEDLNPRRALCYAAQGGRIRMVKALIDTVDTGSNIRNYALHLATNYAPLQKEAIWYLAWRSTRAPSSDIMFGLIIAGHLVLKALNRIKISLWNLATITAPFIKRSGELKLRHNYSFEFAKHVLIEIKNGTRTPRILESILTSGVVLDTASRGVFEIVELCLKNFPELMWDDNFAKELMMRVVKGRHIELFRLVNANNPIRYLADDNFMNFDLMEAVTKWSRRCVSPDVIGAAFLMQRELQWFQVVEVSSFPSYKWLKFLEHKKTYWEVFVEQREELLKDAGQWMKDTSSSCSLVAALIITVAFATTFTVPGGNDSSKGIPIFLKKGSFMVFVVANALALFFSITAALMFLAILTSRYAIEDFLCSLPRKMILGLTFLFLSLAFMLVAFGSALTIVLSERLKWICIPITLLAAFPIILFAILQRPLYVEMVLSTYRPRLYRPLKLWK